MLLLTYTCSGVSIHGAWIDHNTRCKHWNLELDIIALKFKCCGKYYPCYLCHAEYNDHEPRRWLGSDLSLVPMVVCGVCYHEYTYTEYATLEYSCDKCLSKFNPKCSLHMDYYVDLIGTVDEI